jgi:protein CpxP
MTQVFRALLTLVLVASPLFAQAQAHEGREGREGGRARMMSFFKELDLSEQQREQLRELRQANKGDKEARQKKREAMRKQREEFQSLLASEAATDAQLRSAFTKLQEERQSLATDGFDKLLAIRRILTPEQRKKAAALREKQRAGKAKRGHGGPGGDAGEDDEL